MLILPAVTGDSGMLKTTDADQGNGSQFHSDVAHFSPLLSQLMLLLQHMHVVVKMCLCLEGNAGDHGDVAPETEHPYAAAFL